MALSNNEWGIVFKNKDWQQTIYGKQVISAISQANNLTQRGSFNFTELEQNNALTKLDKAISTLELMIDNKILDRAEAELIRWSLLNTSEYLSSIRSIELKSATCYEPMPCGAFLDYQQALQRLEDRLPYLEKIISLNNLNPNALKQILSGIKSKLLVLSQWDFNDNSNETLKQIKILYIKIDDITDQIEKKVQTKQLSDYQDWSSFLSFFQEASIALNTPAGSVERNELEKKIDNNKIVQLKDTGILDPYELELLSWTIQIIKDKIQNNKSNSIDFMIIIAQLKNIIYLSETHNYHPEVLKLILPYWQEQFDAVKKIDPQDYSFKYARENLIVNPEIFTVVENLLLQLKKELNLP